MEGSEEETMHARPVYVAAVDLSCKVSSIVYIYFILLIFIFYSFSTELIGSSFRR